MTGTLTVPGGGVKGRWDCERSWRFAKLQGNGMIRVPGTRHPEHVYGGSDGVKVSTGLHRKLAQIPSL
jgi:hypothetical protein